MPSIAQFGTFEVENYGDRLFPILLENELTKRLQSVNITLFSPLELKSNRIKSIGSDLIEVDGFSNQKLDAIIIGGGDIISFSSHIAPIYRTWKHKMSPHAACWALPIIKNSAAPIIWNAPGIPHRFTKDQIPLVRYLINSVDYLNVRDELSAKNLYELEIDHPIEIIPDTALLLPKLFPQEQLKVLAEKLYGECGYGLKEVFILQFHSAINESLIQPLLNVINHIKNSINKEVLLLPIGYCHNDQEAMLKLKKASKDAFKMIDRKLNEIEIASIIAYAGCFLGTSLHGNITAFAYHVPHLIYNQANLTKLEGFAKLIEEPERCIKNLDEIVGKMSLLKHPPSLTTLSRLTQKLNHHFDRIAEIISKKKEPIKQYRYTPSLLEEYIHILNEKETYKEQLEGLNNSRTWRLANLIKKIVRKIPLVKTFLR